MAGVIFSLSLPPVLFREVEKRAEKKGITKAEEIRRILCKEYGMEVKE